MNNSILLLGAGLLALTLMRPSKVDDQETERPYAARDREANRQFLAGFGLNGDTKPVTETAPKVSLSSNYGGSRTTGTGRTFDQANQDFVRSMIPSDSSNNHDRVDPVAITASNGIGVAPKMGVPDPKPIVSRDIPPAVTVSGATLPSFRIAPVGGGSYQITQRVEHPRAVEAFELDEPVQFVKPDSFTFAAKPSVLRRYLEITGGR